MVYDLRCIYKENEPSFALEIKVRNVSNNINRSLIGNILKSIRTEQKIPIKKVAQNMDVSEATISQFETGKNKPTNEKIALFTEICGQTFNFDLDRNLIMDRVYDIYDLYTDLKKEELNKTIQGFFFPT